ncbi:MAG: CDP-alcohol phosphatidyltransferase family protein [Pseudomonadota bacterium]
MSIYLLKSHFQNVLRPLVKLLFNYGITANQVTLVACIVSVWLGVGLILYASVHKAFLLIPLWMFIRMAFNAMDGMLAREFGQKSALGAYLNELCDVVSDSCLYLPFAFLPHFVSLHVFIVMMLSIIVEMTGCIALQTGASRRYDGPFGKSDRAFAFGVLALAIGLGLQPASWLLWIFPMMSVLCIYTVINRVRQGLQEIRQ